MSDAVRLAAAFVVGAGLGGLYFAALWATVRRLTRLAAWQLQLALWLRVALLLGGLYLVGGDDWRRWGCALAGVVLARTWYVRHRSPRTVTPRSQP
jgi:F1F0 ATPase subunit 2